MGLDQYLTAVKHSTDNKPVDPDLNGSKPFELGYWRKYNHIHGWMENLYKSKGGTDPDFNTSLVQLTESELVTLYELIFNNKLEPTQGFFFGGDNRPTEIDTYSLNIIKSAIHAIEDGYDVYYNAWY